jgi:hypothetical protein
LGDKKMRLKTFIFPVMVVISIIIIALYIWPDISKIMDSKKVAISKSKELEEINAKKDAIDSIGDKISSNESDKIVREYLPESKMEERVVSSINFLADSAGVSLVDIFIENPEAIALSSSAITVSQSEGERGGVSANNNQNVNSLKNAVSVKISLGGEYEKIKLFLDGLQHMPLLNVITSLDISKQKEEKVDGVVVSSRNLLAVVAVNFSYMPVKNVNIADAQNIKSTDVDNGNIEILKKYITKNSQSLDMSGTDKGKENPFIAN